jgi:hypothetical protein
MTDKFELKNLKFQFNLADAEYELDALQEKLLQTYIRVDPRFRRAFYTNFTQEFLQYIRDKVRLGEPLSISTMGIVRTFTENNFIYTDIGWKKPNDMQECKKVLSYNFNKEKYEWQDFELIRRKRNKKEKFYRITFSNNRNIELGENHPIFTLNKGWKNASFLYSGIDIPCVDMEKMEGNLKTWNLKIKKVKQFNCQDEYIYDIFVKNNNNFLLNGILTHNSGKSSAMLSVCIFHQACRGVLFSNEYVCANVFEYFDKIKTMPMEKLNGSIFLIDEEKQTIYGVGSTAKKSKLQDVANIIAVNNISTIMINPIRWANEEANYGLRSFGRCRKTKTVRMMLYNLQSTKAEVPMGMV